MGLISVNDSIHFMFKRNKSRAELDTGAYSAYDHFDTFRREQNLIYPHVSLIDCMERSLPARGATRREYALRKLEENYSPKERQDFTEFTKSIKRKYKDERCQSPRFVLGDQSLTVDGYAAAESTQHRKKRCVHDGRSSNDTGSYRVLQALGSDVIAHWLTPMDMYNVKCAFRNDWKWARVCAAAVSRVPRLLPRFGSVWSLGTTCRTFTQRGVRAASWTVCTAT